MGVKRFTPEQARVVAAPDGDACIIAPAGSGKTTTTAGRVAFLIKKMGVSPAQIACVTYTDAAANTLKERIGSMVVEKCGSVLGLAELSVSTFHGLALDLLRQHVPKFATVRVLNEAERRLFARCYFADIGIGNVGRQEGRGKRTKTVALTESTSDIQIFLSATDLIREENLDLSAVSPGLRDAHTAYLSLLRKHHSLDFAGELAEFHIALCDDNDLDCLSLQRHIAANLKHLLVDEFQDCAPLQSRTLNRLHDLGVHLWAIGDPRQAIFGFRGGDPRAFDAFIRRYPDAEKFALTRNHRSQPGVVDVALTLPPHMGQSVATLTDVGAGMISESHQEWERGDLAALTFSTVDKQDSWGAERMKVMLGSPFADRSGGKMRGLSWTDMAVLVRHKDSARRIAVVLRNNGIPCVLHGMEHLLESPESDAIATVFEFLGDQASADQVRITLLDAGIGLDAADVERGLTYLVDVRDAAARPTAQDGIADSPQCFLRILYNFFEEMRWHDGRVAKTLRDVAMNNVARVARAVKDYQTVHYRLLPTLHKFADFAYWLRHQAPFDYKDAEDQENGRTPPDAVCLRTVHASKGAEWPVVWIPDLAEGEFPAASWAGRASVWQVLRRDTVRAPSRFDGTYEEEVRLLGVAITRAQKWLFVTAPDPYIKNNRLLPPATLLWSRDESGTYQTHPAFVTDPQYLPPAAAPELKLPSYPKDGERAPVNVTFSELFTYFSCPKQFQFRVAWGFPPPVAEGLGHPEGIHAAIAEYHTRTVTAGVELTEGEMEAMIDRHHHVPFAGETMTNKLRGLALQKLGQYIAAYGDEQPVEAVEKSIVVKTDNLNVSGRLDIASRDSSGRPIVDDIKTSPAAVERDKDLLTARGYALGWMATVGDLPARVGTRQAGIPADKGYHFMEMDEAVAEDMRLRMEAAGHAIQLNMLPVDPKDGKTTCRSCDPRALCWYWQRLPKKQRVAKKI